LDDAAEQLVATIVMPGGPAGEFDYLAPDWMVTGRPEQRLEAGRRVRVPLGRGNRSVIGYCVAVESKSAGGRTLKPVSAVIDERPLLSPAMLRLTRWMAEYYFCPWGQVLEAVVPAGVRGQAGTRDVTLLSVPPQVVSQLTTLKLPAKQLEALKLLAASPKPLAVKQLAARAGCTIAPINELRKKGLVTERVERISSDSVESETYAKEAPHE
jgi:primosomal protein N' (replication factor Y)